MNNQRALVLFLCMLFVAAVAAAQGKKALEERERLRMAKETTILDRALGIHNRSNIGEAFENRGKLYPVRSYFDQGIVSGEYPIGSRREYVYRMNPYVGFPGNVIQGRFRENQEFEAVAGYHNRDSARVAVSTKSSTWPATGWPLKDGAGNPIFVSDQDTYCVYSDSANTRGMLGIQVNQIGYAFSYKSVRNMVVFTYEIVNKSANTYPGLYFGMYTDIDVGNALGVGADEYNDDKVNFDKSLDLLYFYDDGYTPDWPGNKTGFFGVTFLQTPTIGGVQPGITDWHYFLYDDDIDRDELTYGIMSSADSLYRSKDGSKYFHLGSTPTSLRYDNPSTIPASGLDLVAIPSAGPYTLHPGETLTFVTAMVAGNTEAEIKEVTSQARLLMTKGWQTPKPPVSPNVNVVVGDRRATITWDNSSEVSPDPYTGVYDFEGYRLYKSTDRGQHWDQFDRNQTPIGPDPVPIADFDKLDGFGKERGLTYVYVDSNLVNGFEYWYCVTAYDKGDSTTESLEGARANTLDEPNVGQAIPRSEALGRTPVTVSGVSHGGTFNGVLTVSSQDISTASGKNYDISFAPVGDVAAGNLRSLIDVRLDTVTSRSSHLFSMTFLSPTTFRVMDLSVNRIQIRNGTYTSGVPISFNVGATIVGLVVTLTDTASLADQRPQAGDSLLFSVGIRMKADTVETLSLQRWMYGISYADANGIMARFDPVPPVTSIRQVAGTNPLDVRIEVLDTTLFIPMKYTLTVTGIFPAPYDTSGRTYLANFLLADSTGKTISSVDSLPSGGPMDGASAGSAWTMTIYFNSEPNLRPTVGTAVEIRTARQTPLSYLDRYTFATMGATTDQQTVSSGLERIKVVPNPYIVSSLYEEEFGQTRREPIRQMKFNNLPAKCSITIFTLDGDRLITLDHNSDNGTLTWDLRSSAGREIASGVYIYLVKTDSAEHIGRFAVIK